MSATIEAGDTKRVMSATIEAECIRKLIECRNISMQYARRSGFAHGTPTVLLPAGRPVHARVMADQVAVERVVHVVAGWKASGCQLAQLYTTVHHSGHCRQPPILLLLLL